MPGFKVLELTRVTEGALPTSAGMLIARWTLSGLILFLRLFPLFPGFFFETWPETAPNIYKYSSLQVGYVYFGP